jgi:hypothetical protein
MAILVTISSSCSSQSSAERRARGARSYSGANAARAEGSNQHGAADRSDVAGFRCVRTPLRTTLSADLRVVEFVSSTMLGMFAVMELGTNQQKGSSKNSRRHFGRR